MNPNHHAQPAPQTLQHEFQIVLALYDRFRQSTPGALNGPLPAGLTNGLNLQVAAALHTHHLQQQQQQLRHQQQHQLRQQQRQHKHKHLQHQHHPHQQQQQQQIQQQQPQNPLGPLGSSQQAAQFYPNSQVAATIALSRLTQAQQQAHRTGQPHLSGARSISPASANPLSQGQIRSFLADSANKPSNSHSSDISHDASSIPKGQLLPNQQNPSQQAFPPQSTLPAQQHKLMAIISAIKSGRLPNELIGVFFEKVGADVFRAAGLAHLLDEAGNLVYPPPDTRNPQQTQPRLRNTDLPPHSMGPAGGVAAQTTSTQLSGVSTSPYPTPLTSSSGLPPTSTTLQPPPSYTSAPHSRQPPSSHSQAFSHPPHALPQQQQPRPPPQKQQQQAQQQQTLHLQQQQQQPPQGGSNRMTPPQSQMHTSKLPQNDEAALLAMKRQLHSLQQLFNQVNYIQRCLSDNVILPTDAQSRSRPMSVNEKTHFEADLIKARLQHCHLNNQLRLMVDKQGGQDLLNSLLKSFPGGLGLGPSAMPPNPVAILPQNLPTRPRSFSAHQAPGTRQIRSLPGHQPNLIKQRQSRHPQHLGPGHQQLTKIYQTSPHPGPAIQPSPKQQVHPQHQQQSRQTTPMSSFPTAVKPQQHAHQISQGGGRQMPVSSPMTRPASTSNNTKHLTRFQNPQVQPKLLRVESPRHGGPGPTQHPRPPSAVQSTGYLSVSPHLTQGNSPNNAAFNQLPAFSTGSLMNGVTPEKLISAIRENITRKGAVWSGQPGFCGKEMDLCKLFSTCISSGGFDHVTDTGLWAGVAMKMDNSINQSELQGAANELCAIYRTFCLDIEYTFVNVLKRKPTYHVGQTLSQPANQQVTQTSTAQNHLPPQADHPDEQQLRQGQIVQANVFVPSAANQTENCQLPVPHTRGGGAPTLTEIMAVSDEQLHKSHIAEDQINKIGQARAQNHQQSQFPSQPRAQFNDASNPALAQAVQPPQPMVQYPHFIKHVKHRLHVEDLKQPPSKRMRPSTLLVTSPDHLQGAGGPLPSAQEIPQQGLEASPVQHPNQLTSPVGNNAPKSPGSKGPGKRNQSRVGLIKHTAHKPSTQTGQSTKPSNQITAEVKAEHAAAKAKREAGRLEQTQGGKPNTPSVLLESNGNQPDNAAKSALPENATSQSDTSPRGTSAPATSFVPAPFRPQSVAVQSKKPPQIQVEDLLEELSDPQGSTNRLDKDGWRGFMVDLKFPIAGEDDKASRLQEDELLGSWLFDDALAANSKGSPCFGDGGFDMMYMAPTMARFIESNLSPHANGTKRDQRRTKDGAVEEEKIGSHEGIGPTRWITESLGEFLFDTNQSVFGAQEESSPIATDESQVRNSANGKGFANRSAIEIPEFSPSRRSSDSTPESVCSTEGHSGNPKRLLSSHSTQTNPSQVASKANGSNDGSSYSCVDEEDALLMYMMGFDDESTIGMPVSSAAGSRAENKKKHDGMVSRSRIREGGGGGFTGMDSQSVLSDAFWEMGEKEKL